MDIKKFEELLNKTVVPSNASIEAQMTLIEPLYQFLNNNLPTKLYKYRSCTDSNIDAFKSNQLWATTADNMNDGYDSRMYFDKEKVMENIKIHTSEEAIMNDLRRVKTARQNRSFLETLPRCQEVISYLDLPEKCLRERVNSVREELIPYVLSGFESFYSAAQQVNTFYCLSETVRSATMWAHYSENESGFCIEYSFNCAHEHYPTKDGGLASCTLYPVIYKQERYEVPPSYIESLKQRVLLQEILNVPVEIPWLDNLMPTKIMLYKSIDWQYEKEWRMFCTVQDDYSNPSNRKYCLIKKPSALYLGRRISEANEKLLRVKAEEKGIPVYKMKLNDNSQTFDLCYD